MRLVCIALVSLLAACHDHAEGFATYQDCYVDHHEEEALPVNEAIVVCCLDHPIDGKTGTACGTTAADCVTYLTANVTGPTAAEIMTSCDEYVVQKGQ
jgi:hypothetical protein